MEKKKQEGYFWWITRRKVVPRKNQ
jgi:hypothetical protein